LGYNLTLGGEGPTGYRQTEDFIQRQRLISPTKKTVYQFDLLGNIVNEHSSIKEAERKTGVINSSISRACAGLKYKSAGGFLWSYNDKISVTPTKYIVHKYSNDGRYLESFPTLVSAANSVGLSYQAIINACKLNSQCGSFRWSREQNNTTIVKVNRLPNRKIPVDMFTIEGSFIRSFQSAKDVYLEIGIHSSNVSACCLGKIKQIKGLTFAYHNNIKDNNKDHGNR